MENRTTKGGKRAVRGILMLVVIGLFGYGIYHFSFRNGNSRDEAVAAAPVRKQSDAGRKALNVNALVIRFQPMTDEIYTNGNLIPDEEVDLSFETSGKITEINFTEGAQVKKGLRTDALVQIVSGLRPGDTLITSGTLQLRTGLDVVLDEIE